MQSEKRCNYGTASYYILLQIAFTIILKYESTFYSLKRNLELNSFTTEFLRHHNKRYIFKEACLDKMYYNSNLQNNLN